MPLAERRAEPTRDFRIEREPPPAQLVETPVAEESFEEHHLLSARDECVRGAQAQQTPANDQILHRLWILSARLEVVFMAINVSQHPLQPLAQASMGLRKAHPEMRIVVRSEGIARGYSHIFLVEHALHEIEARA